MTAPIVTGVGDGRSRGGAIAALGFVDCMSESEKLQKVLARAGYGSRREIESFIQAGRVQVNGKPARLGVRVTPRDTVVLDGRTIQLPDQRPPCRVLVYNKREGEVTTRRDPQGRPTVFDALPSPQAGRWVNIGRLDINSSGLLLLTTDGELANRLMHPSRGIDREYAVRVQGEADALVLERLRAGVELEDGTARFEDIQDGGGRGSNHWYYVVVQEGRHRLVRRLWESQGFQVSRLIRVRYGPIVLPSGLGQGRWHELKRGEINELRNWAQLPPLERGPKKQRGTQNL